MPPFDWFTNAPALDLLVDTALDCSTKPVSSSQSIRIRPQQLENSPQGAPLDLLGALNIPPSPYLEHLTDSIRVICEGISTSRNIVRQRSQ
jgi:hypothetical protein